MPYLEGAPCTTPGHILTVRGFGTEEGQEYVYVCDSAAERDEEAHLRYRKEQFLEAWSGRLVTWWMRSRKHRRGFLCLHSDVRVKKTSSGRYQWVLQERPFPVFPEMLTEKRRVPGRMTMMIRARESTRTRGWMLMIVFCIRSLSPMGLLSCLRAIGHCI